MNKKIALLGVFVLCIINSQAQLLWKVTGNGLKHPSYLFATHQLIPIRFLDSIPGIYKAFNSCNVVVCEVIANNIDAETFLRKASIMPKKENMQNLLSFDDYKLVDGELKAVLNVGLKEIRTMYPALIGSMYKTEIYKTRTGITDDTRSDSYFQLIANEQGKKVIGLETIEQQMDVILHYTTPKRQAQILTETIKQKEKVTDRMLIADQLYKTGKLNELFTLSKVNNPEAATTFAEYYSIPETQTSEWAKKISSYITESPCFITIDALSLPGNNGIIKLLEKQGFKVKAIDN